MIAQSSGGGGEGVRARYVVGSVVCVIVGVVSGLLVNVWTEVDGFVFAEGISLFALLYVVAQGVERINEFVVNVLNHVLTKDDPVFAERRKKAALTNLRKLSMEARGADSPDVDLAAVVDKSELDSARKEIALLTAGVGFGLTFFFVASLDTGLLEIIVTSPHIPSGVDWLLSAAVLTGGATGLHELLSKLKASKEKDELTV